MQAASGEKTTSDATGNYTLHASGGSALVTAKAEGFASGAARARGHMDSTVRVHVQLAIASVHQDVQVNGMQETKTETEPAPQS